MSVRQWKYAFAAAAIFASAAVAQQQKTSPPASDSKEAVHEQLRDLAARIDIAKERGAAERQIQALLSEYATLSASLGGDDPAQMLSSTPQSISAGAIGGPLFVQAPACSGTPFNVTFAGTSGPISPPATSGINVFTATVSGANSYLWDLNLNTAILHTGNADLDITLTSPAGTVVTITTDNGGTNDNVFNGTLWDDSSVDTATDRTYTNLVTATPLAPEGRLETFRGEDPNGTWTLTVADDLAANTGTLSSWSLDISTLTAAPTVNTTNFSNTTPLPIPTGAPTTTSGTTTDTMTISGVDTSLVKLTLYTEITHTFPGDIDMTLTSPSGTVAKVTTDNAASNDDVFNGTLWDADSANVVTDFVFAVSTVVPNLQPEGGFDRFLGEDPNGVWTLTIVDDAGGDFGSLNRWDLNITATASAPSPIGPTNYGGSSGALADFGAVPVATVYTSSVSGMGAFLWDVDLGTTITHTSGADIDMTLTSPAGTVVTITTDNGGTNDNVFNGTLWDDNANDPCVDHVYTNLVLASPLSPEGRLTAFRGEDPNGTWTLTITDDAAADNGTLNSWFVDVWTFASAPTTSSATFSNTTPLPIPAGAPTTTTGLMSDTMSVSGVGTSLAGLVFYTEITHTFAADLEITLTSPAGTIVQVTTDNGAGNDNVFNGTSWDPSSTNAVTDFVFANLVVAPLLSPEGSFDNFLGEDPNGTWTLTINDDASGDSGSLNRWDLTVETCGVAGPVTYCTPGVTTAGCSATISATNNPSVTFANPCVINVANVEGQKSGIIFYSITGPHAGVWNATSFLCVKAPTQRTAIQTSGGTVALCDGTLTLDWNAYQTAFPFSLGNPWSVGNQAWAQAWFRDPPAGKSTNLSNGVELTYQP